MHPTEIPDAEAMRKARAPNLIRAKAGRKRPSRWTRPKSRRRWFDARALKEADVLDYVASTKADKSC